MRLDARMALKVPRVTVRFWVIKVLTTAMGEATSDYAVHTIDPVVAVLLGGAGLAVALAIQLRMRRYHAGVYWLAVVMVAIAGTMAADVMHIVLHIPYAVSAAGFAVVLAIVFAAWRSSEHTLSFHSIFTLRRELFYWAAVLATFALGTAVGDLTAYTLHLGFLASAIVFTVVMAIIAALYGLGLNRILAFWAAYIITRPLGASYADWFGVPRRLGGLDYGRGTVSLVLTIAIVVMVAQIAITRADVQREDDAVQARS